MPGGYMFKSIMSAWEEEARFNRILTRLGWTHLRFAEQFDLPLIAALSYPYGSEIRSQIFQALNQLENSSINR